MRYVKISALCSFLYKPLPSSVDMLKSRQSGIGLDHAPHVLPGLGMLIKCFKKPSLAFSCQASALTMPDKVHLRSLQHAWFGRFQLCMIFYDCAGLHFDADLNEDMSILRLAWNFVYHVDHLSACRLMVLQPFATQEPGLGPLERFLLRGCPPPPFLMWLRGPFHSRGMKSASSITMPEFDTIFWGQQISAYG